MPFPVLLDEDGEAADIVETKKLTAATLLKPSQIRAGFRTFASGHRQKKSGRRPTQLGATLVIGPGDTLLYSDFEDFAGDHADIDEVLAAVQAAT